MRSHSRKARASVVCLLLLLSGTALLYAGGQGEPRLDQVQKLIDAQDYSAALKLLVEIQRQDPGLHDQTSRLMEKIMGVMRDYNVVLDQMNKAVQAGDVQKIQALIPLLQRTNPALAAAPVSRAQAVAGFLKLMDEAQALLADGKPLEALAMYELPFTDPKRAGFPLPQAEFDSAGYGEILVGTVRSSLAAVLAAAAQAARTQPGIAQAPSSVKSLLAQPPSSETLGRLDAIMAPLARTAAAEGAIRSAAAAISDVSRTIQLTSGSEHDDLYLRYILSICLGRGSKREGIAYAVEQLWLATAEQTAAAAGDTAAAAFASARGQYKAGRLARADREMEGIGILSAAAVKLAALALGGFDVGPDTGWAFAAADAKRARGLLDRALVAQEDSSEAAGYRLLVSYHADFEKMPAVAGGEASSSAGPAASAEIARLTSVRSALDARATDARAQEASWDARARQWDSRTDISGAAGLMAESARSMAAQFASFVQSDLQPRDLQYAVRIATLSTAGLPARLQQVQALRARAEDLKDGTTNGAAPAPGALTQKHPEQAVPLLASAGTQLDSIVSDIGALQQELQGEKPYVKSSPGFTAILEGSAQRPGLTVLEQAAQSEHDRVSSLASSALKQVDAAALASREGDNDFALAQAAVTRRDPDGAISALDLATAAYLRSLADDFTEHASARTTTEADALNARIQRLQSDLSVASAQKQIAAINKLIVAKDFLGASDALDAALREWNQTQTGSYPPFDILRQTIQAAVELSQGREISRLDPKADVVNAFIKNAQDNLAAGKLTDAMQNVKDALAVAPNYGAAKVLQLMIKKQTDPAGFEKDATAQIATYLKMGADTSNIDGQKTAYLALLDYSRLDPKFAAQTRRPIQELEYSLGLARRPATAQQVARSNALVQQANGVQQQGTPEAFQQALDLLKQALQVNPDNTDAVRLDGLIRTRMGSTALAALSAADTGVYNEAFSQFLSGAYQDAYDKVLQLWNDPRAPRNKTFGPLQRLKKRLEVQLNIS